MNWGHKIIMVYAVFVVGMVYLAFKSSKINTDLVSEDYYAKELVYQERIDEMRRTSALSAPVEIKSNAEGIVLQFPKEFSGKEIIGDLTIYCPSDEGRDKKQQFTSNNGMLQAKVSHNYHGLQYVKVKWVCDGVSYYTEQKIKL